ncbi:MAG: hypothetical protein WBD93_05760 [Acidobacteriaceae bacterium]
MKPQRFVIASLIIVVLAACTTFAQQTNRDGSEAQQVDPAIVDLPISASTVTDVHLHPFFTTTIRLPDAVTSVAVGAPTLFKVEHSDDDPRLVFIKPITAGATTSNLIICLQSGQEISLRLLSEGRSTNTPVDFVVYYEPRQGFLIGSTDDVTGNSTTNSDPPAKPSALDTAVKRQSEIASPDWSTTNTRNANASDRADSGKPILGALGAVQERGQLMLAAYSVVDRSDHWIEILPPQVELRSPNVERKKEKKDQVLAEQVPVSEYRMTARRLAPGERADGAVEFSRPGFKQSADHLVLELRTASAVDHPLMLQLRFVAPGQ